MDFDTIFTILFILFIVLFQVIGSVIKHTGKQDDTTEADNKPTGLGGRLKNVLERIREELEVARDSATTPPPPPTDRADGDIGAGPGGREAIKPEPGRPVRLGPVHRTHDAYRPTVKNKPAPVLETDPRDNQKLQSAPKTPVPGNRRGQGQSIKHKRILELRQAVVWSEILAPPLALRQDRD